MVISQRAGPELVYAVAGGLLGIATLGGLRAMHQILGLSHLYVAVLQNVGPSALSRRLAEEGDMRFPSRHARQLCAGAYRVVRH